VDECKPLPVAGGRQLEQRVVGVEHLARQQRVPLARQPAGVDALLAAELASGPDATEGGDID